MYHKDLVKNSYKKKQRYRKGRWVAEMSANNCKKAVWFNVFIIKAQLKIVTKKNKDTGKVEK